MMRYLRPLFFSVLVVVLATCIGHAPARAEWFVDAYGGGAFLMDSETTTKVASPSGSSESIVTDQYKMSFVGGARAGYYFEVSPRISIGLALDSSYFKADIDWPDGATTDVVPTSLLVMLRYPFGVTEEFRRGRFQPYFGLGPSVVWSRLEQAGSKSTSIDPGVDARLGMTWMLTRTIGIYGEYRFLYTKPDYNYNEQDTDTNVSPAYIVNFVIAGLTVRF